MNMRYIIREGLSGFRRAKLATAGSVITVSVSLLLLGLFAIVATNTNRILLTIKSKVEMEAFLLEPVTRVRIDQIQQQIKAVEGVEHVQFVSKDEAARIFRREFGEDITKVLEFNPLPPSFKITLKEEHRTADRAADIHGNIMAIPGIDNSVYRKDMLEFIENQARSLSSVGFALGLFIAISAIFLVSNTIRLVISAKRRSIQTMKLVGATRWFVRAPFLIEGVLQGFIGGVLACGFIYYVATFASALISKELAEFIRIESVFYIAIVVAGMLLGLLGSALSVRRHIGESVAG